MTQTGYSNAVVGTLLSWVKSLANWVLKLFNLKKGISPLAFLSKHWLKLLIILMITGVAVDLIVWIVRWRPHWVWFGKKRVVINDKNFFEEEEKKPSRGKRKKPVNNWEDVDYILPSKTLRRRKTQGVPHRTENGHGSEDVFRDELFNVKARQRFTDRREDEVFNPDSLPVEGGRSRLKPSDRRRKAAGNGGRETIARRRHGA